MDQQESEVLFPRLGCEDTWADEYMNQWGAGPSNHQHPSLGSEELQGDFFIENKIIPSNMLYS